MGYPYKQPSRNRYNQRRRLSAIRIANQKQDRNLIYWLVAAVGVLFGVLLTSAGFGLEGGAIAVLGFAPLYLRIDRRLTPELLFGPGTFVFLYHGLGYALGPLGQRYLLGQEGFLERGFLPAQWGAVIGLAVFAAVFPAVVQRFPDKASLKAQSGSKADISSANTPEDSKWQLYTRLLIAWVLFIVITGYLTGAHRRLGGAVETGIGIQSLIESWIQARVIMWFFLGYAAARFRGGWLLSWLLLYIVYSAYVFLDGSRGWVVYAMLFSMIGAGFAGISRKKLLLYLCAFVLLFAPFAAIVSNYRTYYGPRVQTLSERLFYFEMSIHDQTGQPEAETTSGLATILDHSTAQTVDAIFLFTPNPIPYAGFAGMERVLYVFLPRLIVPNRPSPVAAGEIACQYQVARGDIAESDPRCGIGSYTPTVGDGYRRFGWLGILFLYGLQALVFGWLFRWAWGTRQRLDRLAFSIWLVWAIAAVWSMPLTDFFYFILWTVPKYYLFFWGLNWIVASLSNSLRKPSPTVAFRR